MPRGRCHFSLLYILHESLRETHSQVASLADRHLPELIAGALAPDALRSLGRMGKEATHFYTENRRETWGQAVSGLFRAYPDLGDPRQLEESAVAFLVGYISHLTVDEAFRDEVTLHVHGIENWRPIIHGLWSFADEMPVGYADIAGAIDRFSRDDRIGFIDCRVVGEFLIMARPWAIESDPWESEKVFLKMIRSRTGSQEARRQLEENRVLGARFWNCAREQAFARAAVRMGTEEVAKFSSGAYARG